jgi:5-methylcytosine-specific restriction endonuclease McrA
MNLDDNFYGGVDDRIINREKSKARDLRKTQWWQNKIAQEICYYCGRKTARKELTMDHIVPLARGGKSSKGNVVACCKICNTKKKTMLPLEWQEYMESLA